MTSRYAAAALAAAALAVPGVARADHKAEHSAAANSMHMALESSTRLCDSGRLTNHGGQIAFWKDTAVVECGNDDNDLGNDGFVVTDVSDPARPQPLGQFACVASASDIAIWNKLVFLAVDTNNTTLPKPWEVTPGGGYGLRGPLGSECDAPIGTRDENDPERTFEGMRIVSIANPAAPRLVANVELERKGVHNITLLPDLQHRRADGTQAPRLLAYGASPGDTVHLVEVPLDDPASARPLYDTNPATATPPLPDAFAGGCHDITFFVPRHLGVCNNVDAGTRFWDVSDPARPEATGATLHSPGRRDHSSAVTWDGDLLVVTDESYELWTPSSCASSGNSEPVVLWYYDITDLSRPRLLDTQGPVTTPGGQFCHPKQVSVVPMASGRDVVTVSWMGGGTTVEEFPRGDRPAKRLGHYAIGDATDPERGVAFASYWYRGHVYTNNVYGCGSGGVPCGGSLTRGLDVFTMTDDAGRPDPEFAGAIRARSFNFGTQECLPPPTGDAHGDLACP